MRATPIPDQEIWEGAIRRVISPPGGDLTHPDIEPVEALVDRNPHTGAINLSVRCVLEEGDLEKLTSGGLVWLTFWGRMVPWAVTVVDAPAGENDDTPDEALIDRLEDLLVTYDEDGRMFGTSGAGAYFLAKYLAENGVTLPGVRADGCL